MLVGAGAAEVVSAVTRLPRGRAWLIASMLSVLPDADFLLGRWLAQDSGAYHGTFTHSLFAAACIALLGWLLAGPRWGGLAGVGYASHLLVDLLDQRGKTNVLLGWPFTNEQAIGLVELFPHVAVTRGQGWMGALRSLAEPSRLEVLLQQTLIGGGIFLALLGLAALVRALRSAGAGNRLGSSGDG